jgi:signal transduction histidine kinase
MLAIGSGGMAPDLRLRRRTIRGRLARLMALPLLTVAVLFIVVIAQESSSYQMAVTTSRAADLLVKVGSLVESLQQERALTVGLLSGDRTAGPLLATARAQVDTATNAVASSGSTNVSLRTAIGGLAVLTVLRPRVDGDRVTRSAAYETYTSDIDALLNVDIGVEDTADMRLRASVSAALALRELKEYVAEERAFLYGTLTDGGFSSGDYRTFVDMHAGVTAAQTQFNRAADQQQLAMLTAAMNSGPGQQVTSIENLALDAASGPITASPQSWWAATTALVSDLRTDESTMAADIAGQAGQLRRSSGTTLIVLVAFAGIVAIGAAILLFSAARSITRPLAALAAEALTMATIRLPDAVNRLQALDSEREPEPPPRVTVPQRSSTEIAAVAEALDSAQTTAYELATEQARLRRSTSESLANLGRRNQNLLRRQLGFITQLEREETDPGGLANLFELDHLATRMRRNAESLLVLVGESSPRTWSEALPVADVLRAAISEVEDYRRVALKRVDDAYVGGAFVAGIAHMIAELVENGLAFSPPDVDVEIQGRMLPGRYLIGITDQGLGMDPEDMARANARLRGEESFLSAPTRYLGHYVVGHLARQMGIDVELTASPVTGVAARVLLPANVLSARPAAGTFDSRPNGGRPNGIAVNGVHGPALAIDAIAAADPAVDVAGVGGRATNGAAPDPSGAPAWATINTGPIPMHPAAATPAWNAATPTSTASVPVSVDGSGGRLNGRARSDGGADGRDPRGDVAADLAHGQGERTRNGLVKRLPRQRRAEAADQTSAELPPQGTPTEAAAEVRSRLTTLRAGVARGEHDHAAGGRPADEPGADPDAGSDAERSSHAR